MVMLFAESCSPDFHNAPGDEFLSKVKGTNSSYCQLRHNRSMNQGTALRGNSERSSSGSSNVTFNFSSSTLQDKSTESTTLTSASGPPNRSKMVISLNLSTQLNDDPSNLHYHTSRRNSIARNHQFSTVDERPSR